MSTASAEPPLKAVSPGATFERVYRALKAQLRAGRFPAGARLEPAQLSEDLLSSVTPVRDALHRLTGERLVEASRHDGFRTPLLTELDLRHLYAWQEELLLLTLAATGMPPSAGSATGDDDPMRALFLRLAAAAGNPERTAVLENLLDRLGPARAAESRILNGIEEEAESLHSCGTADLLRDALTRYHRRRIAIVPELVAALRAGV